MRLLRVCAALVLALLPATAAAAVASSAGSGPADVTFEHLRAATALGDHFTTRSTISNGGRAPTAPLIAHLNVVSLDSGVYVDPEDWSSSRTQKIPPLRPGAATTLSWTLQAVSAGDFDVYVVVLSADARSPRSAVPTVTVPVHVHVASRQTLNAGGVLPVVLVVPALLALGAAAARLHVRRTG